MDLPFCTTEMVLIIDNSRTIRNNELQELRESVRHALRSPRVIATIQSSGRGCATLSLIEFASDVQVSIPPMLIRNTDDIVEFTNLFPEDRIIGMTMLVHALEKARETITGQSYQQVIVIIGDGDATDQWRYKPPTSPTMVVSAMTIGDVNYSKLLYGYKATVVEFSYTNIEKLLVEMFALETN